MSAPDEAGLAEHTPLPWRIRVGPLNNEEFCDLSICGDIFIVADINGPQYAHQAANTEFIVRAVNSHYALVEALSECIPILERLDTLGHLKAVFTPLEKARAALQSTGVAR